MTWLTSRRRRYSSKQGSLAYAGAGLLLLLWAVAAPTYGQSNPSVVTWEQPAAVASGGGYRGPWRMNESNYTYVDDPTVAISEQVVAAVAWADQARRDIFLQIYGLDGETRLNAPSRVSMSPQIFSWLPQTVISDDAQAVFVLWQEIVFYGGKSFSPATTAGAGKERITEERWDNGSLDLVRGPQGNLYAVWTKYQGPMRFSRSTDGGESFFAPLHVAGSDAEPARGPSLAVDDQDSIVYLAWTAGPDGAADIHIARSTDRGRSFSKPQVVLASDGHSDAPKIAVDSEGIVHLVFAESPAGPFQRHHIFYAQSPRWRTDVRGATGHLKAARRAVRKHELPGPEPGR